MSLILAALLKVATAGAEPPSADTPQPDEMLGAAAFMRAIEVRDFKQQIVDLDSALAKLPRPTRYRGMVQCFRGWVLSELGRDADSDTAIEECYRLRPDDSYATWQMSSVAMRRRDARRAARFLIAAIRLDPAPLAHFDPPAVESLFRQLGYEREDALRAELLAAITGTAFGKDDPAWTSRQARDAIDGLLQAGDRESAVKLLPLILVPRLGLELLVDRRYEAIWPDIEEWAGGDLKTQRDAYVAAARAAFDLDPSLQLRRNYAAALYAAGRVGDATALLSEALATPASWDEDRFDIAMIAVRLSSMLENEGKVDEALGVLRKLKAAAPLDRFPYVNNLVPNEARILVAAGRHAEALALLDAETPKPDNLESDTALGYFQALRFCALEGLGRRKDAASVEAELTAKYATNFEAQRFAGYCGARGGAGKAWLEVLDAPDARSDALLAWLSAERGPDHRGHELRHAAVRGLVDDGAARAAFERYGRTLPASFDEALMGWRTN